VCGGGGGGGKILVVVDVDGEASGLVIIGLDDCFRVAQRDPDLHPAW
jgi:hypothetical protein